MNRYLRLLLLFSTLFSQFCFAQTDGNWDVYIANYDGKPGSVTLDMDLYRNSPDKLFPFILVTGVSYKNCRPDGFPNNDEFDNLYKISDDILAEVKLKTSMKLAGSFTYDCERLEYVYLQDTIGLRAELEKIYSEKYAVYKPYINIQSDPEWEAYLDFLYPSAEIRESMENEKILKQLTEAGDDLSKPRPVAHWIYFTTQNDLDKFATFAKSSGFTIVSSEKISSDTRPFQLQISRIDSVQSDAITELTISLRKKAKELNGEYDGWETSVEKE